ncbi:hypothetical protein, partial [Propionibacterium freudenreichii]|uniref:hypothetical protein n=1 Tax=Propionibacterium freudenreichii TaxID=1744 RepID=UPI0038553E9F
LMPIQELYTKLDLWHLTPDFINKIIREESFVSTDADQFTFLGTYNFHRTNKEMDLTVSELKEQFKNKIKTLLPELELILE